jgi:hypothetical protein
VLDLETRSREEINDLISSEALIVNVAISGPTGKKLDPTPPIWQVIANEPSVWLENPVDLGQ